MREFVKCCLAMAFSISLTATGLVAQEEIHSEPIELPMEPVPPASSLESHVDDVDCGSCECEQGACTANEEFCTYFEPPGTYWDGDTRILRSHLLGRLWCEGEYLAWSARPTRLPDLVSSSPSL